MAHLLIITNCFPISGYTEDSFIWPELDAMSRYFDNITIIPDHLDKGHLKSQEIKNNLFEVDSEYMLKWGG